MNTGFLFHRSKSSTTAPFVSTGNKQSGALLLHSLALICTMGILINSAMDTAEDLDSTDVSKTLIELGNWVTVGQVQPVKT